MSRTLRRAAPFLVAAVVLASCSTNDGRTMVEPAPTTTDAWVDPGDDLGDSASALAISGSWEEGGPINARHTCDGIDISPALVWSGGPAGTVSWAVVLTDDDAPGYAHWAVVNLSPETRSLAEGETDPLAVEAVNSAGTTGYSGPCPPAGSVHTYTVSVYALSQVLEAQPGDPADQLIAAAEAAAVELATSTFTYGR